MNYRYAAASLALAMLLGAAPCAVQAQRTNEPITLNFINAEIEAVARTMAAITGRNIVVDPRVKGTITLSTERPVPPAQAFNQFVATLRLSGYTVVESGGLLKVVPEAEAKLQGGEVTVDGSVAGSQIVTQIFRLNYESAANLVPILRPLISPNNTINVNPGNNSLVITDYADNLQRLGRIIAALDVNNATDVEVINLQHALAVDLVPVVQRLVDASGTGTAAPGAPAAATPGQPEGGTFRTTVIAEPRSNSLIVRAPNAARMNLVRSVVARLDTPAATEGSANIHVVYLRNADATKLATILRAAIASTQINPLTGTPANAGGGGGGAVAQSNVASSSSSAGTGANSSAATAPITPSAQPSTGGQVQADPATNSLIITAPEPQYRQLRAVIDQLDGRRAQVLVEGIIVQVNADKVAQFGIQWQNVLGSATSSVIGFLGTNFTVPGSPNIIGLATQPGLAQGTITPPGNGLNIGAVRNFGGRFILSAIANFLESSGDGNVLSTPNLLTLDNEEAKIVIGENVPFVTGQFTNTGASNGSVNPFTTVDRKDVGLTLRVKPQINENGTVRLTIYQENSQVKAGTENALNGPTTTKQTVETNVLVDDGQIVVIGGLLQDQYSGTVQKVPGLGDVPAVGALFRTDNRTRSKSNLMVFLRPVVVREAQESDALSLDRYELMRTKQQNLQPEPRAFLHNVDGAPIVPDVADKPPAPRNLNSPLLPAPATTSPSVR